ncbi:MAG: flavodoxin I [Sulfurimonas sp.]|jgi:flavodoxin I|uniref:flavodoxin n=1 Tax=Sulfurimonas sp. TaxID=2022749 RepID=UPI0039E55827
MSKIGLFYASSTGNTEKIAQLIKEKMSNNEIDLHDVAEAVDNAMEKYDLIIIGVSTWGEGELQDDWEDYIHNLDSMNFSQKTVAMFGLGDQEEYCDNFLDAMGTIYYKILEHGANVIGAWSTDGYDFDESTALNNCEFVGLALDEDNQFDLTNERVDRWIEQITPYFNK